MPLKAHAIIGALGKLAPAHLAEEWDNVGLLVGNPDQAISGILVSLDVSPAAVALAASNGLNLIIAHHPLIMRGITNVRTDLPSGRLLESLLKLDIAVYAIHTNLDITIGGVNDALAEKLGLTDIGPLSVSKGEKLVKLAVFVPETHVEVVRNAITSAGAGHIGNYSHCTFQTAGTGTFLPLAGSNPFLGRQGCLERVSEMRLEAVMPEAISRKVIEAMKKVHPYEEVAFDVFPLANRTQETGLGRVGRLKEPLPLTEFAQVVKAALNVASLKIAGGMERLVQKAAVCGGSGAALWPKAVWAGADVLVTGDVRYHDALDASAAGIALIDAGHFATERPVLERLADFLRDKAAEERWEIAPEKILINHEEQDIFVFC